jgi:hypothetical protein
MESAWKAISDSDRRKILVLLKERDMTPTKAQNVFNSLCPLYLSVYEILEIRT